MPPVLTGGTTASGKVCFWKGLLKNIEERLGEEIVVQFFWLLLEGIQIPFRVKGSHTGVIGDNAVYIAAVMDNIP